MKTKILSLLMILSMGIFITSCGKDKKDEPTPTVKNYFTYTYGSSVQKYALNAMHVFHHDTENGYDILFVENADEIVQVQQKEAPSCAWFAVDIPDEDLNTVINDPEKIDGADWKFFFMTSCKTTARTRSKNLESIHLEFSKPTMSNFKVVLKAKTYESEIIELVWSGSYTEYEHYIVRFFGD